MSPPDQSTPADVVETDNVIQFERPKAKPLPSALSTRVKAFEYEILPKSFQPWIKDIAERMQCPPDFPAVSAMVVLASLVGRQIVIRPKKHDTWEVTPNLWGAVVGTPGVLKTPALKEPMTSILKFQASSLESFETKKGKN